MIQGDADDGIDSLAVQNSDNPSANKLIESGSASSAYFRTVLYQRTFKEVEKYTAVGVIARWEPIEQGEYRTNDTSLLTIAYTCTTLGTTTPPSDDDSICIGSSCPEDDENEEDSDCTGSACPNANLGHLVQPLHGTHFAVLIFVVSLFLI